VIADANGIGDRGERWIHSCAAGEKAGINHVKVVDIMGAAIQI
jgi:hypothetical protein